MSELQMDTERGPGDGAAGGDGGAGGDRVTVHVSGEVDLETIDQLAAGLEGCHGMVVVDLAGVTFIDSSGLGTLVRARNRLTSEGGALLVQHPADKVRRLFEVTGLTELLAD
jgi:stage II sporulation protein AA (anti-sigma F factor antagonist)